ncbi:sensor histidine kinase [Chitinophaga nivalis]|uniref:Histidine kinase n=1 Tax=Chitinophaga nivalis TaxID=2991709 RepID=A0ABT3IH18_9BACT|nr:histidine kinase [Chitinophaga nivalis]MCW3467062.1 histidine kinase [Chitinophaga nivalis]MCW3483247.1 histidine kinase [Chitinophaga nivalis]
MMHTFFTKYKGIHILFWTIDLMFWTYMTHLNYGTPLPGAVISTAIWLFFQAILVYTIIYYLLPKYFYVKKYLQFILAFCVSLVVSALVIAWLEIYFLRHQPPASLAMVLNFSLYTGMTNFYTSFLFFAAKLVKDKLAADRHQRTIEKEQTENELRFLKSQMNPHFLFNAINSIYVLIRKDQDLAANTLATFADMLRYQLYECNTPVIPIEREVLYLDNYIQLETLRKGPALQLDYQVGAEVRNFAIAPLLLIPFVENAFKYVSAYTNQANHIRLQLGYKKDTFMLEVENTVETVAMPVANKTGGIGLENVKRRLELIYKGNYHLQITPGPANYRVLLTIRII